LFDVIMFSSPASPQGLSEMCQLPDCPLLEGQGVVVVGGGLTAAQLALLAVRHGSRDVRIVMRSHNKVTAGLADCSWHPAHASSTALVEAVLARCVLCLPLHLLVVSACGDGGCV
jgi:hypothetical protein